MRYHVQQYNTQALTACLAVSTAMEIGLPSKAPPSGMAAVGLSALALGGHGRISHVSLPYRMPTCSNLTAPELVRRSAVSWPSQSTEQQCCLAARLEKVTAHRLSLAVEARSCPSKQSWICPAFISFQHLKYQHANIRH